MLGHDIIVIGASAGGIEALLQVVSKLPADLPAAIFIVVHLPAWGKSWLPDLLSRHAALPATHPIDHEAIVPGKIYVAPSNYHLLVKRNFVRIVQGPKENGFRPAIDPLFRTAAKAYGPRTVAVVLSGALDDGTAGVIDVKHQGGTAIAQDPDDAMVSSMPRSAIDHATIDYILPAAEIAAVLVRLAHTPVADEGAKTVSDLNGPEAEMELDLVELDGAELRQRGAPGDAAGLICPDCGGSLYQLKERGEFLQFRCRVGHAWSATSLVAGQAETQEQAMWAAIYSLEERADLMMRLSENAKARNFSHSAARFEAQAQTARQRADIVRQALLQGQLPPIAVPTHDDAQSKRLDRVPPFPEANYDVVVLVAAEGGLAALSLILPALPAHFPAAIVIVQKPTPQSSNGRIEESAVPIALPVEHPQTGDALQPGKIYVAPAHEHLLVNPDATFTLTQAAFVDWAKPSADLLLNSVAATFKQRAIAVILSGAGDNGVLGIQAIHQMGGRVIAQAESTCEVAELPQAAIQTKTVDSILPLNDIASTLVQLVTPDANFLAE